MLLIKIQYVQYLVTIAVHFIKISSQYTLQYLNTDHTDNLNN